MRQRNVRRRSISTKCFVLLFSIGLTVAALSGLGSLRSSGYETIPASGAPALAPSLSTSMADSLFTDVDSDVVADPGDTLQYTVTITNSGMDSATGVRLSVPLGAQLTLVPGSIAASPIAVADAFSATGNVSITQPDGAGDLLTNDVDPIAGTNAGLSITTLAGDASAPFAGTSTNGGNVTATSGDGSFTYNPPPGFTGTDTFTYVVTSTGGNSTGTVTITVSGMIWFVDAAAGPNGDGRLGSPFNCFVGTTVPVTGPTCFSSTAADDPGDNIFLYSGSYNGGHTLLNNQKLIGQGASTTLAVIAGVTPPAISASLPTLGGSNPVVSSGSLTDNIVVTGSNTLRGFTIGNSGGASGDSSDIKSTGFTTLTVNEVTLNGTGTALNLTNGVLNATFQSVATTAATATGISLSGVSGSATLNATTIAGQAIQCISVLNSTADINFGNTSCTNTGEGILLSGNSAGTRTFGTLSSTGGNAGAFIHSNNGAVGGGDTTITGNVTLSTSGNAISVSSPANGDLIDFQAATSVTTTGLSVAGIIWTGAGAGSTAELRFNRLTLQRNNGTALQATVGGVITVTNALGGSTINNTTDAGAAIVVNAVTLNAAFTSINSSGGTNGISITGGAGSLVSGTTTLQNNTGVGLLMSSSGVSASLGNTTVNSSAGDAVDISGQTANVTFADLDLTPDASFRGLDVATTSGTITSTSGDIATTGAPAINIVGPAGRTPLNVALTDVSSTNSTTNGVNLDLVSGSLNIPAAGAGIDVNVDNATGIGLNVTNNTATLTFGDTVINNGGNTGVFMNANTGAITFADLDIDGDANARGIHATGNTGTITTTSGTIADTGTATAIEIVGTSAASRTPLNMQLTGASSNGASSGVILTNTSASGSPGGFRILGAGGTCSSSGTCTGGAFQNSSQDAVRLTTADAVALADVFIFNSAQSQIEATTVNGLTLTRVFSDLSFDHGFLFSTVTNLTVTGGTFDRGGFRDGTAALCNLNGFNVTNLLGNSTVTGATFRRSNTIQFRVNNNTASNFAGTPEQLTVSGTNWNTHNHPCSGDHLSVNSDTGGNFKLIVNSASGINTVNEGGGAPTGGGIGVQATSGGTNGKMEASVTGLKTTNNTAGVVVSSTASGSIKFNVFGNKAGNGTGFSSTGSVGLILTCTTSGTCEGAFDDNSINHTAGTSTNAMQVVVEGNGTGRVTVSNNSVTGNFQRGLHAQSRAGTGLSNLSLHVTNNTFTGTDAGGLQALNFETSSSGDTTTVNTMCLNLANNTASLAGGGTAYRLLNRIGDVFQLQNFAGSGSSTTDIQTWVTTTKSNAGTPVSVTIGQAYLSSGGCATPTLPSLAAPPDDVQTMGRSMFGHIERGPFFYESPSADLFDSFTFTGSPAIAKGKPLVDEAEGVGEYSIDRSGMARATAQAPSEAGAGVRDSATSDDNGLIASVASALAEGARKLSANLSPTVHSQERIVPIGTTLFDTDGQPVPEAGSTVCIDGDGGAEGPCTTGTGFMLGAGQSVTFTFRATIDAQAHQQIVNVSHQGTVSGSNFTSVLTDDPDTMTAGDPTVTVVDSLSLQGAVWNDNGAGGGIINNGIKDGTEPGISGVTMSLFVDANNDNAPDTPGTPLVTGVLTAGGGLYLFPGLAPGNYIVRVDQDNFDAGGNTSLLATQVSPITAPEPIDPDNNTVNDDNGARVPGQPAFSNAITLAYNTEPTAGTGNDTNATLDLGFGTTSADLSITKTDGATTEVPGTSVTYTITASNAGPDAAPVATVADNFPATISGVTWTCIGAGGGTCAASGMGNINDTTVNLPVGGSVTYTATGMIAANATGSLVNTATVSSATSDPVPANNSATDTDTLSPSTDVSITKTDGVTSAVPGGSVTYTITALNSGPSVATGVTVADTFPAVLTCTWTSAAAGGATGNTASGSGNISNSGLAMPVGSSVTYTASCAISAAATGSLSNTATINSTTTDPNSGNNSATDTSTLTPQADLSITKTDGVTTAVPGGSVTYTITASNAGPSNVTGATVADTFPAALTANWTCVGAGGGSCTAAGSGKINDTVNLPDGGSVTYTATATISASATGSLTNTATVTAPGGTTDPTPGNNSANDTDTLTPQADLSITKTDGSSTEVPGTSVSYTITASNAGPSNAPGSTVADTFPASIIGVTWTCVGAGGGTCTAMGSGNVNDVVNLPAGGSVTYAATGTISTSATGSLSNTATVTAGGGVTDPNAGNNLATDTNTLTPQADLSISKTDGVTAVDAGGTTTYTIVATNPGPSYAPGTTVVDTFPVNFASASWTCAGAGGGTCSASGNGNINDTVDLPVSGSVTYTVSGSIPILATGSLVNTATVTAGGSVTDPTMANNSATDSDTINACTTDPVVLNNAEAGTDSLRWAVARACPGSTITFGNGLPGGTDFTDAVPDTITLTTGEIVINKNLTTLGPGANFVTVTGNDASRIFSTTTGTIGISGLRLAEGGPNSSGGAISNNGATLTLTSMVIDDNEADGNGGGIDNNAGTTNINQSTISNNKTFGGGGAGVRNGAGATVTIRESTISGNIASYALGGGGGVQNSGALTIINSTISGNSSPVSSGAAGGGLWTQTGSVIISNSTITNNNSGTFAGSAGGILQVSGIVTVQSSIVAGNVANNADPDVVGSFLTSGFNLVGSCPATCTASGFTAATDLKGTLASPLNPQLGLLANNGGPTQTHALLTSSPAVDTGDDGSVAATTDQRGELRPFDLPSIAPAAGGDDSDIGAYELNTVPTTTTVTSNFNPSVFGQNVTFTATVATVPPGGAVTGNIDFSFDGNPVAACQNVALNGSGQATCSTSTLSVGAHTIYAEFDENLPFLASSGTLTQNVDKANTTTAVTAAPPGSSVFGQSVTFTATVTAAPPGAGTPTGTVTFNIDGNLYCVNTPLNGSQQASCTQAGLPALGAGIRNVVAIYNGDANFNGSSGTLNYTVNKADTVTTITGHTPATTIIGQTYAVTWTVVPNPVQVNSGTPTGMVTVSDGTGGTCTAPVAAGTCNVTSSTMGVKTLVATYAGDANFNGSVSAGVTHTVNLQITGTIRNGLTLAPISGITVNLIQLPSTLITTATTNASGVFTFAGQFTGGVRVIPATVNPPYYDPFYRNYALAGSNITGADFLSYANVADIPRTITHSTQWVVPGAAGTMPVILNSQNNEASVAYTIIFDINPFATPPTFVCGANAPGCTIVIDSSVLGRVGVTITPAGGAFTRPDGTPLEGPEAAGPKEIAKINFQTLVTATMPSTDFTITNSPVNAITLDAANNPLLQVFIVPVRVVFAHGVEGDVAGRHAGNGVVDSTDVVQVRRFVTGLDTPVATHNEFQRADASPATTKGNGILDATDVIQIRRYGAGLDAPQSAGGSGAANPGPIAPPAAEAAVAGGSGREIKIGSASASTGSRVSIPVGINSTGDETAISFNLRYDETRLTAPRVDLGKDAPEGVTLTVNTDEPGLIRVLLDSNSPFARSSKDQRSLIDLTFDVSHNAPSGDTRVELEDVVISDSNAKPLTARLRSGSIAIAGPNPPAEDKPEKTRRPGTIRLDMIEEWLNPTTLILRPRRDH